MNAKNLDRLECVDIFGTSFSSHLLSQALSSLPYFLVYRLGYGQDVMYNISIACIIQNIMRISPTIQAREIAAPIASQSGGRKEEYYEGRRENQEACGAPAPA